MSNPTSQVTAVVLAAGKGPRMKSALPKVMHPIAGRPMIHYPVRTAIEAGAERVIVVVGHGRERVEAYLQSAFGSQVETERSAISGFKRLTDMSKTSERCSRTTPATTAMSRA